MSEAGVDHRGGRTNVAALTVLPGEGRLHLHLGRLVQVHGAVPVEADLLHVPPGPAEQGAALVPEAHGGPVEVGVLGVVGHAVVHDEVEVALELLQVAVVLRVDALPHGGEVHRVLDVVKVVGDLRGQRSGGACDLIFISAKV